MPYKMQKYLPLCQGLQESATTRNSASKNTLAAISY